jgi:hypothetical protein
MLWCRVSGRARDGCLRALAFLKFAKLTSLRSTVAGKE